MEKKKRNTLILAVVLLVVLVTGIAVYQHVRPKEVTNFEYEEEQKKPDENTGSEAGVVPGIQIPGYKEIVISAGTTDVQVELTNPEANNVYFEISFYLPDTDEVIYTSKLIKPGQSIYNITLNRAMEAGEYPLVVKYATYSTNEDRTPRNGAEVNCQLVVR